MLRVEGKGQGGASLLSDRHGDRLMICSSSQCANTVDPGWQTPGDGGLQIALSIACIIDPLEKGKGLRIEWGGGVKGVAHVL